MLPERSLIGYISKTHGTGGQVTIVLNGDFGEDLEPGEPVFLETEGIPVPFFIEECEDFFDKAIVKLEFIDNVDEARKYIGCKVYIEHDPGREPGEVLPGDASEFIGFTFQDTTSGLSGTITGLSGVELNPLFEVEVGGKEYLIPVQPVLITAIDYENKVIKMDLPEGLII